MVHFEMTEVQLQNLEKYVQEMPTKHGMPIVEFLRQLKKVEPVVEPVIHTAEKQKKDKEIVPKKAKEKVKK